MYSQSSKSEILEGLDLWCAAVVKHNSEHLTEDGVPWRNADDLYNTIDSIQASNTPWRSYKFSYVGPKPANPSAWMEETYELNTHDALHVLEQQLATSDFDGQTNYIPYQEFNSKGDCAHSNLMSGHWAFCEAVGFSFAQAGWYANIKIQDTITHDKSTHGSMLVPVIAGSDKTTVSVATGHQEYHPVYISPGIISNTACRGHGNGVLPVAFLPIPKSK